MLIGIGALALGVFQIGAQWRHPLRETVDIDLSLSALPRYTFFTFARGWIAYLFSLLFTLVIASCGNFPTSAPAGTSCRRSTCCKNLPVLTFLPGLEFALVALFPHSNAGLELACILSIFLGQVWNMTFSYYDSLGDARGLPHARQTLLRLVEPVLAGRAPLRRQRVLFRQRRSTMAGGWFFLVVCEAFASGDWKLAGAGIGSYMGEAMSRGDVKAEMAESSPWA